MSPADREVLANLIWVKLKNNLDDRGCFNGIDCDIIDEIDSESIGDIDLVIANFEKGIFS